MNLRFFVSANVPLQLETKCQSERSRRPRKQTLRL